MQNKSEVDLRVSQELKNNQDFIYQTNQAIQNLRFGLSELNNQNKKLCEKYDLIIKTIAIDFENLNENLNAKIKQQDEIISEYEKTISKFTQDFTEKFTFIIQNFVEVSGFEKSIEEMANNQKRFEKELKVLNDSIATSMGMIQGHIQHKIDSLRKDLTPDVPKVDPVKKELEDKIKAAYVNFDGLVREIALLKKAVAYDQKKFENIYTLIERLKVGMK